MDTMVGTNGCGSFHEPPTSHCVVVIGVVGRRPYLTAVVAVRRRRFFSADFFGRPQSALAGKRR